MYRVLTKAPQGTETPSSHFTALSRTGRFLPACSLFLFIFLLSPLMAENKTEHRIGLEYLHAAQSEFAAHHLDSALDQIRRGLDLDPGFSDLLLLRSQITIKSAVRNSLEDARIALQANTWLEAGKEEGITQLVAVLLSIHRWQDAVSETDKWMKNDEIVKYPLLMSEKIKALYEIGDRANAEKLLKDGLSRHPDNFSLIKEGVHYRLIAPADSFIWFNRFHSKNPDYLDALFWYFHQLEPSAESLKRCNEYIALGGSDPMVYADALRAAQLDSNYNKSEEKKWLHAFLDSTTRIDLDVAKIINSLLRDSENLSELSSALMVPTLNAQRDYDRDSQPEEVLQFSNGKIVTWKIDDDQDGLIDLTSWFDNGQIIRMDQETPSSSIRLVYATYPEVATAWIRTADSTSELVFSHRSEELRTIDLPAEGFQTPLQTLDYLRIAEHRLVFDTNHLISAAWLRNEYYKKDQSDWRIYQQTRHENGKPVGQRIDTNRDGHFDTWYWFNNGIKEIGFRDVQDDGSFSVAEIYDQGKLFEYRFVSEIDGAGFILRPAVADAKWDLNHDQRFEKQQILAGNAWLKEMFSSKRDANFDPSLMEQRYKSTWRNLVAEQGMR